MKTEKCSYLILSLLLIATCSCKTQLQQKVETGYAEVNGTKLYYEIIGQGHPIVLLNGFSLDTRMWDDQFKTFGQHYQVVRFDMRGYGLSDFPTKDPYNQIEDLKALLEYLDISKTYVIGNSFGGYVAINFTIKYPDMVDALVTVDATLGGYNWSPDYGATLDAVFIAGMEKGHEAALDLWFDLEIFDAAMENPMVSARLKEIISDYSGYHWSSDTVNWGTALGFVDIERLNEIKVPTIAIVGERDAPDFDTIASILAAKIQNAQKIVMDNVGHMANMEDPTKFNDIVLELFSSLEK